MHIERLSKAALIKIINGEVRTDADCIVKFYSNDCHLCHALQGYYLDISKDDDFSKGGRVAKAEGSFFFQM